MSQFLFVLCPPFSGSTVLWRLLTTSPHVSTLPDEGQFLPSVVPLMRGDPWNPDKQIRWAEVRAEWEKVWDCSKPVLLEKSPPNIVRAFEIERHFEPSAFISMIRNPYAFCEGHHRRLGSSMRDAAEQWVSHAAYQRKNIDGLGRVFHFSYESFTDDPQSICDGIQKFLPALERLDADASFKAKAADGHRDRRIQNLNDRKIDLLGTWEVRAINTVLDAHRDLVNSFGYEIIDPAAPAHRGRFQPAWRVRLTRMLQWIRRIPKQIALRIVRLRMHRKRMQARA